MNQIFLSYIPVVHQGYLEFFAKFPEVKTVYILDRWFLDRYRNVQKDIRAVAPHVMKGMLESLGRFEHVEVLSEDMAKKLNTSQLQVIAPDEEITHKFISEFLPGVKVMVAPIFLRWDASKSTKPFAVELDGEVTEDAFHRAIMQQAAELAERSKDWWRQVAAILVKEGEVIFSSVNTHVPSEQQPYVEGDPRADFSKGVNQELGTAIHAEAKVIGHAAKAGISTAGGDLYALTFPCPACAKLVAESGIKRLFFRDGYAMLDGERVLKANGVEILRVG